MKAIGERSISSFIRFLLDAAWWMVVALLAMLATLLVLSFCVNLEGRNVTMDLPVAMKLDAPVDVSSASIQPDAKIGKLRGNLRFAVRGGAFLSVSILLIVLLFGVLLWLLTQLRHVFRSLSRGLLFVPENAQRIR